MAIKITTKPRTAPVSGDYPYGAIRDDVAGPPYVPGTPVNTTVYGDFHQYFARMAANAGITLNDLLENTTNGFQYVQALNTLYNRADSALATTVGAGAATNLPVLVTGCGLTTAFGNTFLGTGFLYYNGQMLYAPAGLTSIPTPSGGNSVYLTVTTADALPTLGIASFATGTPNDSAKFAYSSILTYKQAMVAEFGYIAWSNLTLGTGVTAVNTVQYTKNSFSDIIIKGVIQGSPSAAATSLATLPAGFIPTETLTTPCFLVDTNTGTLYTVPVEVDATSGLILFSNHGQTFTTGWRLDLSPIRFNIT